MIDHPSINIVQISISKETNDRDTKELNLRDTSSVISVEGAKWGHL